jgi:hypothetical protein
MIRARFYIKKSDCDNDYRPVKWPIKYPYWCSAESDNSRHYYRWNYFCSPIRKCPSEVYLLKKIHI